jgi:hypothetical protein
VGTWASAVQIVALWPVVVDARPWLPASTVAPFAIAKGVSIASPGQLDQELLIHAPPFLLYLGILAVNCGLVECGFYRNL